MYSLINIYYNDGRQNIYAVKRVNLEGKFLQLHLENNFITVDMTSINKFICTRYGILKFLTECDVNITIDNVINKYTSVIGINIDDDSVMLDLKNSERICFPLEKITSLSIIPDIRKINSIDELLEMKSVGV